MVQWPLIFCDVEAVWHSERQRNCLCFSCPCCSSCLNQTLSYLYLFPLLKVTLSCPILRNTPQRLPVSYFLLVSLTIDSGSEPQESLLLPCAYISFFHFYYCNFITVYRILNFVCKFSPHHARIAYTGTGICIDWKEIGSN